jgi:hypothetical protein
MQTAKLIGDLGATIRDAEKGLEWGDKALERFAADRFMQLIEMNRSVERAPVSRKVG